MPFVQIKLIEGVASAEQKKELIQKVSELVIAAEGENIRPFTHVVIEEIKSLDWAIGGKPVSASDVKAIVAGKGKVA